MNKLLIVLLFLSFNLCYSQEIAFPKFQKKDSTYTLGNKLINDEFFELEHTNEISKKWLKEQETFFKKYMNQTPSIRERFNKINSFESKNFLLLGDRYYSVMYGSDGLGIYCKKSLSKSVTPIITNDDIVLEKGKFANIRTMQVSANNEYLAYSYATNGSEQLKIKVFDLKENKHLPEVLDTISSDEVQWYKDGFFYKKENSQKIFYHQLFTNQEKDSIIFSSKKVKSAVFNFKVVNNQNYLIVTQNNLATKLQNVYYLNLKSSEKIFLPLIIKHQGDIDFIDANDTLIYFTCKKDNSTNCLFFIKPSNPKTWNLAIPVQENELLSLVKIFNSHIVASYKKGPNSLLRIFNLSGELASGINLPLGYSISNIQGFRDAESFYFDLGSILYPYITYEYNYKKEKYAAVANILVNFDFKNIEYNYKEIEAKDSKKIPIIICKKKETVLSGSPTLLESYGGYGISYENEFSSPIVDFIERGGVYVRAYIRGGGELGEDWHKQGSGINKSNTFNDFISVAKFLVDSGYTNPNKLAIKGGSHGGLVVGVAYSLEPKLFKAAICNAAPLDILNLLLKTKSIFQNNEYGDFRNQNELDSLVKYNPYYNIKDSINYPSLFIYASENDERVPFINQAKFAALMQNRERQKNPILFFLEKNAGHYGAENTYEEAMDKHILESKFLYKELGMD